MKESHLNYLKIEEKDNSMDYSHYWIVLDILKSYIIEFCSNSHEQKPHQWITDIQMSMEVGMLYYWLIDMKRLQIEDYIDVDHLVDYMTDHSSL